MIPHNRPTLGKEEEMACSRVLQKGWLSQGEEVQKFEDEFCDFLGLPHGHAVALSNGTASLYLALRVLNAENKKILFPGYVCSALRHAVSMANGKEQLIDVSPDSPNISKKDVNDIEHDISIIPHMYGLPIDIENNRNPIIEDCCQALGAKINDEFVGLKGDIGIFSFYVTKLMTSGGQGGMFISKNKELVDSARDYREFDLRNDTKKRFNFQMTDLQAAIGREQLKKLPSFLQKREEIFNIYKKEGFTLLDTDDEKKSPVRYRAIIKTSNPLKMIKNLEANGIKAIIPTEDWEILGSNKLFPNSLKLSKETVSIPVYPSLTISEIDQILSVLTKK
jgi:perosamine synthetase